MNDILDASYFGEIADIRSLLGNGVDVNTTDRDRNTPLHMAALGGHTDCVELLIERKADVEVVNAAGNTPLHLGITTSPPDCIELQLKAGAPVNACNENGDTPLSYAIDQLVSYHTAEYLERHLALLDLLLQYGADAKHAHKALAGIYRSHRVVFGAENLNARFSSYRRRLLQKLLQFGLEPGWTGEQGDTLLHTLCRCDAPSADLELLVNHGFDVDARNHAGETPMLVYLDKPEPPPLAGLMVLLDANADINVASHAGHTPLQVVRAFSRNEHTGEKRARTLAKTLLDWGADERIGRALS